MALDKFTLTRLRKFASDFRHSQGQFPTQSDFEKAGFKKDGLRAAVKEKYLSEVYVNLTTGAVVKGYKPA